MKRGTHDVKAFSRDLVSRELAPLKIEGIVSRDEYFFNWYFLDLRCWLYNFCFLFDKKIKLKFFACSFEVTY